MPEVETFKTPEEAAAYLKRLGTQMEELRKRVDGSDSRMASREDLQREVAAAVQALTSQNDKRNAEMVAARNFHADEYGLPDFIERKADGRPVVRLVGRMEGGYDEANGEHSESWLPGLLDDTETHGEWHRSFREAVNDLNVVRLIKSRIGTPNGKPAQQVRAPMAERKIQRLIRGAPDQIRKAWADVATAGAEWLPVEVLPRYEEGLLMERRLEALFEVLPMTKNTLELPVKTTGLRPYNKAAVSGDDPARFTSSSLATTNRTYTAKGWAVRTQVDPDAAEDAILSIEPVLRAELIAALIDGFEDCIINGDTTATHQDTIASWDTASRWGSTGLGGSADHRRISIGLRARAADVSNTTDQSAAETTAGLLTARGKLASGYGFARDVVVMPSYFYYVKKLIGFSEVLTVANYGPNASILTGEVGEIAGMPIVLSPFCTDLMNASGIYDGSTTTYGQMLLFNRRRFIVTARRGAVLESARDITRGIDDLVVTARKGFETLDDTTTKNVHQSYKLTGTG
jgi:hypothetical protein